MDEEIRDAYNRLVERFEERLAHYSKQFEMVIKEPERAKRIFLHKEPLIRAMRNVEKNLELLEEITLQEI